MSILYAQNVGIGTAVPASKLSIAGNLSVGTSYVGTSAPVNGTIIEGKVGIGMTNPSAKLHITTTDTTTVPFQVDITANYLDPSYCSSVLGSGSCYRIPITIDNSSNPNNLTDYQILVTLNTASLIAGGKLRTDCGDLRFTDSDGLTQLNYWIESGCNTPNTRIWVKVPSIPASSTKTIYVYYGNSAATSQSSIPNTFIANAIYAMSGNCNNMPNCGPMDNHIEADNIRNYPADICAMYVNKIDWGSVCDNSLPNDQVRNYFYSRFRFLFVPDVSGTWNFAVDCDDGGEIVKSNADMYGGIHEHTMVASWYGFHGWCNCQTYNGAISLTAGEGIWLDYIQADWEIAEAAVLWVLRPGAGSWLKLTTTNFPNQIFARKYTFPEPAISSGAEESSSITPQTAFYIQNKTGNVGIGTTSPSYKLQVCGDIATTSASVATGIVCSSDLRFKKDVKTLTNVLEKVMQLRGVSFYWKTEEFPEKGFSTGPQIGVIAQEVEKVYPELVKTEPDGYKSVDYAKFTPILIEAIKELYEKNKELEAKIDEMQTLKKENATIKRELEMIKEILNLKAQN